MILYRGYRLLQLNHIPLIGVASWPFISIYIRRCFVLLRIWIVRVKIWMTLTEGITFLPFWILYSWHLCSLRPRIGWPYLLDASTHDAIPYIVLLLHRSCLKQMCCYRGVTAQLYSDWANSEEKQCIISEIEHCVVDHENFFRSTLTHVPEWVQLQTPLCRLPWCGYDRPWGKSHPIVWLWWFKYHRSPK